MNEDAGDKRVFHEAKRRFAKHYWIREMAVDTESTPDAVVGWRAEQRALFNNSAGPPSPSRVEFDRYKQSRAVARGRSGSIKISGPRDMQAHNAPMLQVLKSGELVEGLQTWSPHACMDEEDEFLRYRASHHYWAEMIEVFFFCRRRWIRGEGGSLLVVVEQV